MTRLCEEGRVVAGKVKGHEKGTTWELSLEMVHKQARMLWHACRHPWQRRPGQLRNCQGWSGGADQDSGQGMAEGLGRLVRFRDGMMGTVAKVLVECLRGPGPWGCSS